MIGIIEFKWFRRNVLCCSNLNLRLLRDFDFGLEMLFQGGGILRRDELSLLLRAEGSNLAGIELP